MRIDNLNRLYVHELKDLYNAEKQLAKALPQMADTASNSELKTAFKDHLKETNHQIERLEKIFNGLDFSPGGEVCAAMQGIIEEGKDAMSDPEDDSVRDAAMIAAAQKAEHYEIAGYGTVRSYAEMLGREDDHRILSEILEEEKAADLKLNHIALEVVNPEAAAV